MQNFKLIVNKRCLISSYENKNIFGNIIFSQVYNLFLLTYNLF
jgi:hypothetical protein